MLNRRLYVVIRRATHQRFLWEQYRCLSSCPLIFHHSDVTRDKSRWQLIPSNLQLYRQKFTKKQSQAKDDNSDSEDEADDLEEEIAEKGSKVVSVTVPSLRTDLLIKSGLQVARNKVEAMFYQSRIRVNGRKIVKKSAQISDGDEVDVIRGFSPMNPNFLVVSRLEVLSVKVKEDNYSVRMKRTKSLVVENYDDPWKQSQSAE